MTLICQACAFRGDFSAAVDHYRATRHPLEHKGTVQDLSGFVGTCRQCQGEMAIYPSQAPGGLGPERSVCDTCIFSTLRRALARTA